MKNTILYLSKLIIVISLLSCSESDFKKEIPIKEGNAISRLAVVAALDNNSFYVFLNKSYPISSQKVEIGLVDKATVKLYEDDVLILNVNKRDPNPNSNLHPSLYVYRKNIVPQPGKTYRLEITSEGYPSVQSTVVAPQYPTVNNAKLDTTRNIIRPLNSIYSNYPEQWNNYFFPLSVELTDMPNEKNYYIIEVHKNYPELESYTEIGIATIDRLLIQDHPLIEAEDILSFSEYSTYLFPKLLISDLTFSGKNIRLDLLLNNSAFFAKERPEINLFVKSITSQIFDYYRSFTLQNPEEGMSFFSEPIVIQGNITDGYGYFSVTSAVHYKLLDALQY